jgi:tetratricopeptide (TPR) repeat protein
MELEQRARAALAQGHLQRAIDLADLGLNRTSSAAARAGLLRVRAQAELSQGLAEAASLSATRALELSGAGCAESHALVAAAAALLGRHEEALAAYERAAGIDASRSDWIARRAVSLLALGRDALAGAVAERALGLDPCDADANLVRGTLLLRAGRPDDALQPLRLAAGRAPARADVHTTLALALAASGDVAGGLREYEWRQRLAGWNPRSFDIPAWDGGPLEGQRLLVWDEQGLGDTLQFVRFARRARARGASLSFHGEPRLCRLLATSECFDQLVSRQRPRPPAELHASVMSLPALLGASAQDLAREVPYLSSEPELQAIWDQRLRHGERLVVALAWQGNPAFCDDGRRSMPLGELVPMLRALAPRARFVSVQKGFGRDQLHQLPPDAPVADLSPELDGGGDAFVDSAAVLRAVDVLVTTDTALAHLAGALGAPVWLALAKVPDWRWGVEGTTTAWYPTMRLFRQARAGDWGSVVGALGRALAMLTPSERQLTPPLDRDPRL